MKVSRENLRQAVWGTGFLCAVLGTVIALCSASFEMLLMALRAGNAEMPSGFFFQLLRGAVSSETMCFALPIAAALPFTASCYEDLHSGFIIAYLPRAGCRDYITGKLIACFASGGLAPVAGIVCFVLLTLMVFAPRVTWGEGFSREMGALLWASIPLFFSGAFWSLVGMTASALTSSKHMAYAAPFILFYVLVILSERYFKKIVLLNPKEWMRPAAGIRGIALLVILSGITALVFRRYTGRRLRNL